MKLGLTLTGIGPTAVDMDLVLAAESMGFDSVWVAEAYGSDAVSPAAWILARTNRIKVGTAIMQMTARAPTVTAMSAMTLNMMSGGRFIPGIGASGPQVVEGWHGTAYGRPLERTREYISIMRQVFAREAPLTHEGRHYNLPYAGDDGSGLGKPLKSMLPANAGIPIYTASITPNGLATSAEVADGVFPIWMDPDKFNVLGDHLHKGFEKSGMTLADYDIAPFVGVSMGDDLGKSRQALKASMSFYIGGMGARDKNFYTNYARAMGFDKEALEIQDLFLSGKRDEAAAKVPNELVDGCNLVGPPEHIRDRLQVWKRAGAAREVGSMLLRTGDIKALEVVAKEML